MSQIYIKDLSGTTRTIDVNGTDTDVASLADIVANKLTAGTDSSSSGHVLLFAPEGYPLPQAGDATVSSLGLSGSHIEWVPFFGPRVEEVILEDSVDPDVGDTSVFLKWQRSLTIRVNLQGPHKTTVGQLKDKFLAKLQGSRQAKRQKNGMVGKSWYRNPDLLGSALDPDCIQFRTGMQSLSRSDNSLDVYNIVRDSEIRVNLTLSQGGWLSNFNARSYPSQSVPQTEAGQATFFSTIYALVAHLRRNTKQQPGFLSAVQHASGNFTPLIVALKCLLEREILSVPLRCSLLEGFYQLFRQLVPGSIGMEANTIFESTAPCLALLLGIAAPTNAIEEMNSETGWRRIPLVCALNPYGGRLVDPVRPPEWWKPAEGAVCSRSEVHKAMREQHTDETQPTEDELVSAGDIASLLAAFPDKDDCLIWAPSTIPVPTAAHAAAKTDVEWRGLCDEANSKAHLRVHMPLELKSRSQKGLVTLSPTRLPVVYLGRLKDGCASIEIFDPLSGETTTEDVDQLAAKLARQVDSKVKARLSRPPAEIIVVVLDISGSMCNKAFTADTSTLTPLPGRARGDVRKGDYVKVRRTIQKPKHKLDPVPGKVAKVLDNGDVQIWCKKSKDESRSFVAHADELEVVDGVQLSRLDCVKQLLHAFANRSMAYDLPHAIGLTLIGAKSSNRVTCVCPVTEAFENFKAMVDATTPGAKTALYDGLAHACNEMEQLVQTCDMLPSEGVSKRILCLTDGADTCSQVEAHVVARNLQASSVVVDAVMIADQPADMTLRGIVAATGGSCFHPESLQEALRIFEKETVLSLKVRQPPTAGPEVNSMASLKAIEAGFGDVPGTEGFNRDPLPRQPSLLQKPATTASGAMQQMMKQPPPASTISSSHQRSMRRIIRELEAYLKDPHPYIRVYPCESDMRFWNVLLIGPEGTPYEGGTFALWVSFPPEYPSKAPEVRFQDAIHHCNINSTGRVCHSIFDRNWTANLSIRQVFDCVYGLLLAPDPEDPLDSVLAMQYHQDREAYEREARTVTQKEAARSTVEERQRDLLRDQKRLTNPEHPDHLVCPLTMELFDVALLSPVSGRTFERKAIVQHLQHSQTDPIAGSKLTVEMLIPNLGIQEAVEQYHKEMKAKPWWQTDD